MVTIETLSIVFTGISISLAAFYYINTLRNTRKNQELQLETRQSNMFMELYETYRSPEFRMQHSTIIQQQWEDYDDFMEKYGPETNPEAWANWMSVGSFFNGIGVLLKKGLVDIALVEELLVMTTFVSWIRIGPIVREWRARPREYSAKARSSKYSLFHGFEYLYNELKKRDQEYKDLKT